LLASAGSGMDQSSTRRKCTPVRYLGKGRLMGGRGVIFPGSYRLSAISTLKLPGCLVQSFNGLKELTLISMKSWLVQAQA
jgi:hypothetical protein